MSRSEFSLERIYREAALAVSYMCDVLGDPLTEPFGVLSCFRELGWNLPLERDLAARISGRSLQLIDAVKPLKDLLKAEAIELGAVAEALRKVLAARTALVSDLQLGIPSEFSAAIGRELPRQLLDYAVIEFLRCEHPVLYGVLGTLGIVRIYRESPPPEDSYRRSCRRRKLSWEMVGALVSNPARLGSLAFGWGTDEYDGERLVAACETLLRSLGFVPSECGSAAPMPAVSEALHRSLSMQLVAWHDLEVGVRLHRLPGKTAGEPDSGIGVAPYVVTTGGETVLDLGEGLSIAIDGRICLDGKLTICVHQDGSICAGMSDGSAAPVGTVRVTCRAQPDTGLLLIGSADGDRIEVAGTGAGLEVRIGDADAELGLRFELRGVHVVLTGSSADGFIRGLLSGAELDATLDCCGGFDKDRGFYLEGSGHLDLDIPVQRAIGGINVNTVHLAVRLEGDRISAVACASFSARLGPVLASVRRMGVCLPVVFERSDGDQHPKLGSPEFVPPDGAGLSIDASGIVGSGYVEFDDPNKRYAGILALRVGEIGLTAVGLIETTMPDGSTGFAMVVNIGVTFNPAIQLSYGFTLNGVGGLIGINRTMEIDVLRVGIKNRTLDSILFPDPSTVIANAQKIISDLRAVFPPSEGRFIVGPMIKIGWGTPTIITADVGIFLELPAPVRVVFMGQLEMVLPEKAAAIVVIHLDTLGVLDFEKGELSFQASLYDSRVLEFAIYGDAAFLVAWKNDPRFALSLGGFHPKFVVPAPPSIFADLKRLTICISSGSNLQLSCTAYQALTPNSLQFGARVDLYAAAGGAEIKGYLSFDTLFYFSPFSFEVWMGAGVHIRYEGVSLASIELSLLLSGPTPWVARGKAKFEVCWVSVSVKFCKTWGSEDTATLPTVDAWGKLQEALRRPESWGTVLPVGKSMVESLSVEEGADPKRIVVHSAGRLEVRQNVVPLDMALDMVANAPVAGHDLFTIELLSVNGEELELAPVQEFFARGQFEDLGDQRLSVPSFEKMTAGATTAASEAIWIPEEFTNRVLEYESILIKPDGTARQTRGESLAWEEVRVLAGARGRRAALRRAGPNMRFSDLRARAKVGMREERYAIVNAQDLSRADVPMAAGQLDKGMTRAMADRRLSEENARVPDLRGTYMVVPESEVAQ